MPRPAGEPVKIHLGCGRRNLPGFIHVDLDAFPHVDYCHRIDRLPMFADGAAALIYCSHAFEYFDRQEGARALAEWHRVLKPGGILRLAVPDFGQLAAHYLETGGLSAILGPLFGRMNVQGPSGPEVIYHRTAYDFGSLSEMLLNSGFHSIRRYDWRETLHKDHDDFSQAYLPHLDKENGRLISLNVEATR